MNTDRLPLEELSIEALYNGENATYEVPIYQRNYAWEEEEIQALVQDAYDAFEANKPTYYIGTLVAYNKGNNVYEVIDGQQRLTTMFLVLSAFGITCKNKLTYRARKRSKKTIENINDLDKVDEKDNGIYDGFRYAKKALDDIVNNDANGFKNYFLSNVHIVRYIVPKDVDLNHYFEVMNSRGEQLEKHEIVKAKLSSELRKENEGDFIKFSKIWEACSEMSVYVQQKMRSTEVFGANLNEFVAKDFNSIPNADEHKGNMSIDKLIEQGDICEIKEDANNDKNDSFQPIIDFPNFLLIVLKITLFNDGMLDIAKFALDDKELINEFKEVAHTADFARKFAYNLLKAKYLLDNYVVHHVNNDDRVGDNPWRLQRFTKDKKSGHPINLLKDDKTTTQTELVQLLSMFEVAFTPRQRKNYLFYCLLHLFGNTDPMRYLCFLQKLAAKYFHDVYLSPENLTETNNRPKPNSFDSTILKGNHLDVEIANLHPNFNAVYGDGTEVSKGIQLFVFNYMDYKIWKLYADSLRGEKLKNSDEERKSFFNRLGCGDFGLKAFDDFYFSRTRKSLEHFYPQAKAGEGKTLNAAQINCFGNFAMIGADANSRGSNWNPKAKIDFYKDSKFDQVSVASLKLRIMMQMCQDNITESQRNEGDEWNFDDIRKHQDKMLSILIN